ncbi:probable RNA-binding protein 18 isoform X1 [Pipistrellus kuhlii]|uniref:probable RNA-binding protein 18 isoform X1 n=1 Tax=Pipistrellus kuhlii TaxID=59472 RepID=UPI00174EDCAE|nr:probable RNA-binding protein 18 isoform X1 [Pipistrellus kuhlii]
MSRGEDAEAKRYHLLKLLQKFGTVKQFDFLFHKSGALEGQPRGYCFVNFETKQEAEQAIQCLNGKLALSKKLVVRWAHAQVKMVSHRVFSASRAHYLQNRNEENYQRPFYSKENEISFARLAVIFSFCILLKRHAREIFLHSFFHLRLCLVLPFSYRSFDQRILIALSYYFYFLQEVYNYIKLDCSFPGECFLYQWLKATTIFLLHSGLLRVECYAWYLAGI